MQRMPWPQSDGTAPSDLGHDTWMLDSKNFPWLQGEEGKVTVNRIHHVKNSHAEGWITTDGHAYFVQFVQDPAALSTSVDSVDSEEPTGLWVGSCIYPREQTPKPASVPSSFDKATEIAINPGFSVVAIGLEGGDLLYTSFPLQDGTSPAPTVLKIPEMPVGKSSGCIKTLEWTSDGYALAVGWESGWAIVSVGGRFLTWSSEVMSSGIVLQDQFMQGITSLFWGPGNFELFVTSRNQENQGTSQIAIVSFAKSSFATQQTPDNTRYAFLTMDDRVLVYRGADQPDMSVINPESDVWQSIKIPIDYIANNWPLRYSTISSDGRLIAVAGRRGLTHYSLASGRWKLFTHASHEQAFVVRGGILWFHHVLIAAVEMASKAYQIQLYSRDLELTAHTILHTEIFEAPIITISLIDNSLLVYTASNELYHYLVVPTADTVALHSCGSISFEGVVVSPHLVRGMSWMIPPTQKNFGDAADDMTAATILLLVGGQLVLLTPRKNSARNVKYDLRILADRIEFCWIHLRGVGALENSLWGYDGEALRIWLDALTISSHKESSPYVSSVVENVRLPLEFYPLSVLMDKGIIIGAEQEILVRSSLSFVIFRHNTNSHLFIHHILRYHLQKNQVKEAVQFATPYQSLVFFSHSLEVLLHTVLESEDDAEEHESILPAVIEFLDHFDASLEVVVGCARKTEMTRWKRLFDAVGNPRALFEACLREERLPSAASYLLVLHNLQQLDETSSDAVRLLSRAIEVKAWDIAKDLMRFLRSIDEDGNVLNDVLKQVGLD